MYKLYFYLFHYQVDTMIFVVMKKKGLSRIRYLFNHESYFKLFSGSCMVLGFFTWQFI